MPNIEMPYLSMGMTNSYKIAAQKGVNIVRIRSKIFGERVYEAIPETPSSSLYHQGQQRVYN